MTVQQFFDQWNGRGVDFDKYYGFQCMDLAQQYNKDVVGGSFLSGAAAKDVWNTYPQDKYTRISNTPTGVPVKGDIIIWGTGVGPYGHIAVFSSGDVNQFTSFDQNWPVNSLCHYQQHNYNGVLGWLHPKVSQPVGDDVLVSKIQAEVNGSDSPHDKIVKVKQILGI